MLRWLFLIVALAINSSVAYADEGALIGSAVSTSNASARTGDLGPGWKLVYCTVATHYRTGTSTVTSVTTDLTIPATTAWQVYLTSAERYIAFILDSSTGSCSVYRQTPGPTGLPPQHASAGGGGSHSVTNAGGVLTNGGGTATATVTDNTVCVCSVAVSSSVVPTCSRSGTTLSVSADPSIEVDYICALL